MEARQAAIAEPNGGANAVESSRQVSAAPAPIAASVEPPRLPPPIRPGQGAGANVLDLIPGAEPAAPGFSAWALEPPVSKAEETEATNAARTYEHELREKLLASPTRPGFFHRHALATALAALVIAIGTGAASFAAALAHRRADEARAAVELARKGLARDTQGALREAARVLEKARKAAPDDDEANVLSAEVLGLLAHDFGDAAALASARSLLSTEMGDEALGARWLLAREGEEERDAAQVLLDRAADGRPLERALAGEILLARRDYGGARLHLEAAASANPPLLRALCLLGDLDVARADLEAALKHYALVLHAQPTHPRAALGAASVRFRLGRDLKDALRTLEAVQADKESPVPVADRLRMSLVMSRLLAANGRTAEADARLADTASHNPGQVDVAVAQADVFALEGNLDGALRAAQAALRLAPSSGTRELLARLQLRRGRYRELLASSEQTPSRTLRLYRGIAYFELGELAKARAEIEETRRDGKMTPEAGAWMALAELASGRKAQASAIVSALLAAAAPHPLALVARARIDLAEGHPNDGEKHLRQALERDPELHEARCDLGHLLLSRGRFAEAREVLEKAVARNPYRLEAQRELGQARLSSGDPAGAARDFEVVLAERPHEVPILISLSAARLATGNAADARRAAQRALELEPRSAPAALAAGRAAQALGLSREARHYFEQVTRQGGKAAEAAEARRALASLKR
ncbi:MAG TPA: tetratricopeptide repeat protein [Anaeromyxobacteraceae bacterium]|nr:tetratricopeptide repeat protein [Anaeromyxobacteraceae bacterium]